MCQAGFCWEVEQCHTEILRCNICIWHTSVVLGGGFSSNGWIRGCDHLMVSHRINVVARFGGGIMSVIIASLGHWCELHLLYLPIFN
jgi:hypothetical protein